VGSLASGKTQMENIGHESSYPFILEGWAHLRDMGPLIGRSSSISRAMNRVGEGSGEIDRVPSPPKMPSHRDDDNIAIQRDIEQRDASFELTPEQKQRKETLQVYLLEMGILFHSVFIGMSLSVSIGNEFVVLLIAIVFHRMYNLVV